MSEYYNIFAISGTLILLACCLIYFCLKKKQNLWVYFLFGTLLWLLLLQAGIERSVFYFYAAPGELILLAFCLFFCLKKTHDLWSYFLLGWTLLMLLSLPAGIWQSVFGWSHLTMSGPIWKRFISLPLLAWPFNTAGYSVRWIFFEVLGKKFYGPEHQFWEYLLLMAVQTSILALIFAMRYKSKKTFVDWGIICLFVLFLVNSLVNVGWYWGVG